MECHSCGAENADSATFCSLCLKPFGHSGTGDSREVESHVRPSPDPLPRVRETETDVPAGEEVIARQDTWRVQRGPDEPWTEIGPDEAAKLLATPGAVVSSPVSSHHEYVLAGCALLPAGDVPRVVIATRDPKDNIGTRPDRSASGAVPVEVYRFMYRAVVDQAAQGPVDQEAGVIAFAAKMLPILESVGDEERIVVRRQPDARDALCVESSGVILGYLP